MLTRLLTNNLDIIFFIYGLAFFIIGIAIFIQPRKKSAFRLSSIIWLLALFGLSHGLNEWLDMFDLIKPNNSHTFDLIQLAVLTLSYVFFFEFGRRLLGLGLKKSLLNNWLAATLYLFLFVLIFLLPIKEPSVLPRYILGFPGGLLTAFGFYYYYRSEEEALRSINVRFYFQVASISVAIYGVFGGLITPQAEFFPASVIHTGSFLNLVGIPVQLFRAVCAIFLSWSIWHILYIFNWEITTEHARAEEMQRLYKELERSHVALQQTQSQLIQAEKMEVVGRLASGAAHEVKNPLAIIGQGVEYLKQNVPGGSKEVSSTLNYMEEAITRADDVIKGLLDFSSLSKLDIKEEDVGHILESALLLTQNQFAKFKIKITKDYQADLPLVRVDKNRIEQVFVNVILNAVQAMPSGGELRLRVYAPKAQGDVSPVIVAIEDSGGGIAQDNLGKIFDPFFTTKREIGGTGLGLSVVKNIIEMHGGKIIIENREDARGTRVIMEFKRG